MMQAGLYVHVVGARPEAPGGEGVDEKVRKGKKKIRISRYKMRKGQIGLTRLKTCCSCCLLRLIGRLQGEVTTGGGDRGTTREGQRGGVGLAKSTGCGRTWLECRPMVWYGGASGRCVWCAGRRARAGDLGRGNREGEREAGVSQGVGTRRNKDFLGVGSLMEGMGGRSD